MGRSNRNADGPRPNATREPTHFEGDHCTIDCRGLSETELISKVKRVAKAVRRKTTIQTFRVKFSPGKVDVNGLVRRIAVHLDGAHSVSKCEGDTLQFIVTP